MNIAYLRVSTGKQDAENQRFTVDKFAQSRDIIIDQYVIETVSDGKDYHDRKLGEIVNNMNEGDLIICTEISRLARSLYQVFELLKIMSERGVSLITIKDNFELNNTIQSKVLAFCFGLSSEIEKSMISQKTKQALDKKRADGVKLGRPVGSKNRHTKLSGKENTIIELIAQGQSYSSIARIFHVDRTTLIRFLKNNGIYTPKNRHNKSTQIK